MNLLAIDTSSKTTVLGLKLGEELIDRSSETGRSHSRDLLPSIESLIRDAGIELESLDGIIFGQGPGSFTGLRIAVGVVQGLAYGLDIPVVPVSSMACLAQGVHREYGAERVAVALKARLEEVYFGAYGFSSGVAEEVADEVVLDVRQLASLSGNSWSGVGDGWEFQAELEKSLGVSMETVSLATELDVHDLVTIGQRKFNDGLALPALEAKPVYLREQVAQKP